MIKHTIWSRDRKGAGVILLILAVALSTACKERKVGSRAADEEPPRMASVLSMGDPKAEPQLVTGFYGVENGAWRWVGKQFAVNLLPPFGSAQKGGKLTVKLTVPPVVIEKNKSVSLSATVGNAPLAPETYTTPGDYVFVRDVPASALIGDAVRVDFVLDKAMPPAPPDIRELGLIVLSVGLESK
jgi:hypothetical protein